eukprot:15659320-Heterocapsa_arctica.AAC.1
MKGEPRASPEVWVQTASPELRQRTGHLVEDNVRMGVRKVTYIGGQQEVAAARQHHVNNNGWRRDDT